MSYDVHFFKCDERDPIVAIDDSLTPLSVLAGANRTYQNGDAFSVRALSWAAASFQFGDNWHNFGNNDWMIFSVGRALSDGVDVGSPNFYMGSNSALSVKAQPYYAVFSDNSLPDTFYNTTLQTIPYYSTLEYRRAGEVYWSAAVKRGNLLEHYVNGIKTGEADITSRPALAAAWANFQPSNNMLFSHTGLGPQALCTQPAIDAGLCINIGDPVTSGFQDGVVDHEQDYYGFAAFEFPLGAPPPEEIIGNMNLMKTDWVAGRKVINWSNDMADLTYRQAQAADAAAGNNLDGEEVIGFTTSPNYAGAAGPLADAGMTTLELTRAVENLSQQISRIPGASAARVGAISSGFVPFVMTDSGQIFATSSKGTLKPGFTVLEYNILWSKSGTADANSILVDVATNSSPTTILTIPVGASEENGIINIKAFLTTNNQLLVATADSAGSVVNAIAGGGVDVAALTSRLKLASPAATDIWTVEATSVSKISTIPVGELLSAIAFPAMKNAIFTSNLQVLDLCSDSIGGADLTAETAFTITDGVFLQGGSGVDDSSLNSSGPWHTPTPGKTIIGIITGFLPSENNSVDDNIKIGDGVNYIELAVRAAIAANSFPTNFVSFPNQTASFASPFLGAIGVAIDGSSDVLNCHRYIGVSRDQPSSLYDVISTSAGTFANLQAWDQSFSIGKNGAVFAFYMCEFDSMPADFEEAIQWMADNPQLGIYAGWHGRTS